MLIKKRNKKSYPIDKSMNQMFAVVFMAHNKVGRFGENVIRTENSPIKRPYDN